MGGVFVHARPGIWTPFLSEDWFSLFEVCLEFGKESGMKIWIYDESSYPSGFAGGLVHDKYPHLAQRVLVCHVLEADEKIQSGEVIGRFWLFPRDQGGLDYRVATPGERAPHPKARLAVFCVHTHPGNAWLNGAPYVDTLHPDAAEAFLDVAYEPYRRRFSKEFGVVIPGVFTDEPYFSPFCGGGLPWTPDLPQVFNKTYGQDLISRLPELVFDTVYCYELRVQYWSLLSRLFVDRWMRPIYEWCDCQGLNFTGHLWEHVFSPELTGNIMLPAAWQHIPGIDVLGRDRKMHRLRWDLGDEGFGGNSPTQMGNIAMVKAVTSVAHQMNRDRVLSETYGGAGWEISFEEQKAYAEWQAVLGVNLLNQHLSHYSLRGERKYDHPPSFRSHQPWWDQYPMLHEYIARLYYALAQGCYEADFVVLHPMTSLWTGYRSKPDPFETFNPYQLPKELNDQLKIMYDDLLKALSSRGWSYDLADELLLQDAGRVEKENMSIGAMKYPVLIIPPVSNLLSTTLDLLTEWLDQGGTVAAVTPLPRFVNGRPDPRLDAFLKRCRIFASEVDLLAWLPSVTKRKICFHGHTNPSIYTHIRSLDQGRLVFVCNMELMPQTDITVQIAIPSQNHATKMVLERWDLTDGSIALLSTKREHEQTMGDILKTRLDFAPGESHLLVLRPQSDQSDDGSVLKAKEDRNIIVCGTSKKGVHEPKRIKEVTVLEPTWRFRRLDPNVLVLDSAEYQDGEVTSWHGPLPISEVKRLIRRAHGLPDMAIRDMQPWRRYSTGSVEPTQNRLSLRFTYRVVEVPAGELQLVVEEGRDWDIAVNDIPVRASKAYWLDPAFHCIPIGGIIRPGKNTITMQRCFQDDLSLEPVYLIGDFAVETVDLCHFELSSECTTIQAGSWIFQGYPFFSGRAVYSQEVIIPRMEKRRVWLELSNLASTYALLRVNGKQVGTLAWQPYRAEITDFVRAGVNTIDIEIANSLRNVLGPHHRFKPRLVSPRHWQNDSSSVPQFNLVPDGFPNEVRIIYA